MLKHILKNGVLRNTVFCHPDNEQSEWEGSIRRRDSSPFRLRMTRNWQFRNSPNSNRGITLLGVIIALAISAIAINGVLAATVACMSLNQSNNNYVTAVTDAQYVLEEIKGLAYTNINSSYVVPQNLNNLDNENIMVNVTELDSRIKEVVVTVNWSDGKRARSYALTTRVAH